MNLQLEIDSFCNTMGNYYPTKYQWELFKKMMLKDGHDEEEIEEAIKHYER